MLAIGWAGVKHAGQWQADPRSAGSALAGPWPWWGFHKPAPFLTPAPVVALSALLAGVAALTRSSRQGRGGSGQVPGATAALLDRLTYPSA